MWFEPSWIVISAFTFVHIPKVTMSPNVRNSISESILDDSTSQRSLKWVCFHNIELILASVSVKLKKQTSDSKRLNLGCFLMLGLLLNHSVLSVFEQGKVNSGGETLMHNFTIAILITKLSWEFTIQREWGVAETPVLLKRTTCNDLLLGVCVMTGARTHIKTLA